MTHRFGWKPDLPDHRDHIYSAPIFLVLPPHVDLRPGCPPVYDQGQLGSCTAQAIAAALEFDQMKQGEQAFTPSRLFIYYNERWAEGTVDSDAGAAIRDGIKSVNKQGACNETEWTYDISQFAIHPPTACYKDALNYRSVSYQRVMRSLRQMKACLASGFPFVIGISVYSSFESDQVAATGIVPMPQHNEDLLGGHCMLVVGYDDAKQAFLVRNSWGTEWAGPMHGHCYLSYAYLLDPSLSSDFWVIRSVE